MECDPVCVVIVLKDLANLGKLLVLELLGL